MKVSQGLIVTRGLTNCCPNCGGPHLFKPGTLFELNPACPDCGMRFEKDEGFFLGAMSLNYGITIVLFLVPVLLLWVAGVIGPKLAVWLAIGGSFVVPLLLYRSSRSWQLMLYYFFLPQHLPANRRDLGNEDENV